MKYLSVLGSTGSIGTNTLDVVRQYPDKFRIMGLSAGSNIGLLKAQIMEFNPRVVSVAKRDLADRLAESLPRMMNLRILHGEEGCKQVATLDEINLVVAAMVGARGLIPTLAAIEHGKHIALANKETLVMAGSLVMTAAKARKVRILPVDSEHSALFQCLKGNRRRDVRRLILTASGGPFRVLDLQSLRHVTPEEALNHPRWKMGPKITIDSATMMNKGLEIQEARWLFDMDYDMIDIKIHPQSIVHSLVEYRDGSMMAQMGVPDMKVPIAYALSYPKRIAAADGAFLDLLQIGQLEFYRADHEQFPALDLAYRAGRVGGTMPAVMNGANETAVEAFLQRRIGFLEIIDLISRVMSAHEWSANPMLDDILAADRWARMHTEALIEERVNYC